VDHCGSQEADVTGPDARLPRACYSQPVRLEIEQAVQLIQRKDTKFLEEALALLQKTVFSFA